MATYEQLAKDNPQSAANSAFRFLAKGSSGFNHGSQLAYYTQALSMTVQHLVAWGMSGHEPSLKAYQGLVKVLPSSDYPVATSRSDLQRMRDWVDDVPNKVRKTKSEIEKDVQRLKGELRTAERSAANDPLARLAAGDLRERIAGYESMIKAINERARAWSHEASKLNLRKAKPEK